jgi:hypothetical protein
MLNRLVEFGFIISRGDKRSVELAIPQDMQCKPGVVFIRKPMTKSDKHPLNSCVSGECLYRFLPFPAAASQQSINPINLKLKGENNEA